MQQACLHDIEPTARLISARLSVLRAMKVAARCQLSPIHQKKLPIFLVVSAKLCTFVRCYGYKGYY